MLLFGASIFLSSILYFWAQPLLVRYLQPLFGGGAGIWLASMLFFQMLLLGGYAYSFWMSRKVPFKKQAIVHGALLFFSLLCLPLAPSEQVWALGHSFPALRVMLLLSISFGFPGLLLAANSTLLQYWIASLDHEHDPYRYYALSSAGSMLAVLSYPVLIEPASSRSTQALVWSCAYIVFSITCIACANRFRKHKAVGREAENSTEKVSSQSSDLLWWGLPAVSSALLLSITNKVCRDLAPIAFLALGALSLFLISYIVAFNGGYRRRYWFVIFTLLTICSYLMMFGTSLNLPNWKILHPLQQAMKFAQDLSIFKQIIVFFATLFSGCMVCHGELYRWRPSEALLPKFYMCVAAGGVLGGLAVTLIAPIVFSTYVELHICFLFILIFIAWMVWRERLGGRWPKLRRVGATSTVLWIILIGAGVLRQTSNNGKFTVAASRSFYGTLKVQEYVPPPSQADEHHYILFSGPIVHGLQYLPVDRRKIPTTYYAPLTGVGLTFRYFPKQKARRVGLVGLGAGTLAAWGKPDDLFRFYEIDEGAVAMARQHFSFLQDSEARTEIVMGDARVSMEQEAAQNYDILVLDAFTADSIPTHLLTLEAFRVYAGHLNPQGVIAVHISNQSFNLRPVVESVAKKMNFQHLSIHNEVGSLHRYSSDWILMTRNQEFLNHPAIAAAASALRKSIPGFKYWTDEKMNLLEILDVEGDPWLNRLRRWGTKVF
jgi:spermidine synthase